MFMAKVTRGCRHTDVLFQNYFQIAMTQGDAFKFLKSRQGFFSIGLHYDHLYEEKKDAS